MTRVLIVGPAWVGDTVLAQPLFMRLHQRIANLTLDVLAPPWTSAVLKRMPEVSTVIDNPFTSFARMIVVQSGNSGVGQWLDEKRNVYQDYVRAFAEEPPPVNSVAIMTDTDNTGEQATAYYGDIYFTAQDPDTPVSDEDNATN